MPLDYDGCQRLIADGWNKKDVERVYYSAMARQPQNQLEQNVNNCRKCRGFLDRKGYHCTVCYNASHKNDATKFETQYGGNTEILSQLTE